jgi:hypothetical protein
MTKERREEIIRKFLAYSFDEIEWNYEDLTDAEQALCSQEEYNELASWARQ